MKDEYCQLSDLPRGFMKSRRPFGLLRSLQKDKGHSRPIFDAASPGEQGVFVGGSGDRTVHKIGIFRNIISLLSVYCKKGRSVGNESIFD